MVHHYEASRWNESAICREFETTTAHQDAGLIDGSSQVFMPAEMIDLPP
jgi:hypothetical protein